MLRDLVLKNRSYRGFDESVRISRETLEGFVDCARLCPSSVNKQPLKYFLAWEPDEVEKVQGLTKWARALPDGHCKESARDSADGPRPRISGSRRGGKRAVCPCFQPDQKLPPAHLHKIFLRVRPVYCAAL